jgi:hypothetical protein
MATPPTFSSGAVLTAAQMNSVGLWLVKTQTIGSAVASVTVTDAFSSDYDNYLITVSGGAATTDSNIAFRLGASATAYSGSLIYSTYTIATVALAQDNNAAFFNFAGSAGVNGLQFSGRILGPNLAKHTAIGSDYLGNLSGGNYNGIHKATTQHTSFLLAASAGTWTGGTIKVYGMRN